MLKYQKLKNMNEKRKDLWQREQKEKTQLPYSRCYTLTVTDRKQIVLTKELLFVSLLEIWKLK